MKMHLFMHALLSAAFFLFAAPAADASMLKHIIVIVMENKDAENSWGKNYIYGNTEKAPYINRVLMPKAARAKNFMDQLPGLPSEPHYIWMEAGTNRFSNSDEFVGDKDVPVHWSTTSKYHLAAQIEAAKGASAVDVDDLSRGHQRRDRQMPDRKQQSRQLCGAAQSIRLFPGCLRRSTE
jgi:hypothetical protein